MLIDCGVFSKFNDLFSQEAKQILNVQDLDPDLIQKVMFYDLVSVCNY